MLDALQGLGRSLGLTTGTDNLLSFAIIGGGLAGTLTAHHLIAKAVAPCRILLFHNGRSLARGIAYDPYSEKHLLNVTTDRMSAFGDRPKHFLDWVMALPEFSRKDRTLIANSYLPRSIYGRYLEHIWQETLALAGKKKVVMQVVNDTVTDLALAGDHVHLTTADSGTYDVHAAVIATGNHPPRDPRIPNSAFFTSKRYFRNPWEMRSVEHVDRDLPVLLLGNGLTMVDTVIGLLEQGFKGTIHSISPNGFNILPHRHSNFKYSLLTDELPLRFSLLELVRLVNKHVKMVREYGISAAPVIDSLRPHTQRIWKGFTDQERAFFMRRLRHLWGVARHRIAVSTHDMIQQLRIDGRLLVTSGRIIEMVEQDDHVLVEFLDKKEGLVKRKKFSRIINCTGPETDLSRLNGHFLKGCLERGLIAQDPLKLGIRTDTRTYQVLDPQGRPHRRLYTLGSNLKGELWESTAVSELRAQAEQLAHNLLEVTRQPDRQAGVIGA